MKTETLAHELIDVVPELPDAPHSGMSVRRFFVMHLMGALFPITAGILLYGWRAVLLIVAVIGSAAIASLVWKRIGIRGEQLRLSHTLWLATLLALTLPAHLASRLPHSSGIDGGIPLWPILPAAGVTLVIFTWLLGGVGSGRVHPVLMTHLLLIVCFQRVLVPHYVLQRDELMFGDVLDVASETSAPRTEAWIRAPIDDRHDAVYLEPASQQLIYFTSGSQTPDRAWLFITSLLRGHMPPLEDLIVGGEPGPIGTSCALASLIGGLFLLYRGLIDFRVPLIIFVTTIVAMLILPIPAYISTSGPNWVWLAARHPNVGWPVAITFVNYELMAGPLMFTAFFLATAPAVRPMARRARVIYAMLVGVLCAIFQLYTTVSEGPYIALLVVSLLAPTLDKWFRPRPLV